MTSLWKVPDAATQALMTQFHRNLWEKKMGKVEALRDTQIWLIKEGWKHPESQSERWAGPAGRDVERGRPGLAVLLDRLRALRRLAMRHQPWQAVVVWGETDEPGMVPLDRDGLAAAGRAAPAGHAVNERSSAGGTAVGRTTPGAAQAGEASRRTAAGGQARRGGGRRREGFGDRAPGRGRNDSGGGRSAVPAGRVR